MFALHSPEYEKDVNHVSYDEDEEEDDLDEEELQDQESEGFSSSTRKRNNPPELTKQEKLELQYDKRYEKKFKRRYETLQKTYEHRLTALWQQIQNMRVRIDQDEIIRTMQTEPLSATFIAPRIDELLQMMMMDDKERFIKQLSEQQAHDKSLIEQLMTEKRRWQKQAQQQYAKSQYDRENLTRQRKQFLHLKERYQYIHDQCLSYQNEVETQSAEVLKQKQLLQDFEAAQQHQEQQYHTENAKAQNQLQDLKTHLMQTQTEKQQLEREVQEIRHELDLVQERHQVKSEERSQHMSSIQEENKTKQLQIERTEKECERLRAELGRYEEMQVELRQKYEAMGEQVEKVLAEETKESKAAIHRLQVKKKKLLNDMAVQKQLFEREHSDLQKKYEEAQQRLLNSEKHVYELENENADLQVKATEQKIISTRRLAELEEEISNLIRKSTETLEAERGAHEDTKDEAEQHKKVYELRIQQLEDALKLQSSGVIRERSLQEMEEWQKEEQQKYANKFQQLKEQYDSQLMQREKNFEDAKKQAYHEMERTRQEAFAQANVSMQVKDPQQLHDLVEMTPETHISRADHKAQLEEALDKLKEEHTKELKSSLEELEAIKKKEYKTAMLHVRQGIQQLEASLKKEQTLRQEEQKQHQDELDSLEKEQAEAKTEVVHRLEQANVNIGRMKELIEDLSSQNTHLKTFEKQTEQLRQELQVLQERHSSDELKIQTLHQQLLEVQPTTDATLNSEVEKLKEGHEYEMKEHQEQIQELTRRMEALVVKHEKTMEKKAREYHRESQKLHKLVAQETKSKQLVEDQMMDLVKKHQILTQEYQIMQHECQTVRKTMEGKDENHATIQQDLQQQNAKHQLRQTQLNQISLELKGLIQAQKDIRLLARNEMKSYEQELHRLFGQFQIQSQDIWHQNQLHLQNEATIQILQDRKEAQAKIEVLQKSLDDLERETTRTHEAQSIQVKEKTEKMENLQQEIAHLMQLHQKLEAQSVEMQAHLTEAERDKKSSHDLYYGAIDYYTQVLLNCFTKQFKLNHEDEKLIHSIQQHWKSKTNVHQGSATDDKHKMQLQSIFQQRILQVEHKAMLPIQNELYDLQISVGILDADVDKPAEGNQGNLTFPSMSRRVLEKQKENEQLKSKVQYLEQELEHLRSELEKVNMSAELRIVETQDEIQSWKNKYTQAQKQYEDELKAVVETHENFTRAENEKQKQSLEKLHEENHLMMREMQSRLEDEQTKVNDLRRQLMVQAGVAQKRIAGAKQVTENLTTELNEKMEEAQVQEAALSAAHAANRHLVQELQAPVPRPRVSSRRRPNASLSNLSSMMQQSLQDMHEEGIRTDAQLDASTQALTHQVKKHTAELDALHSNSTRMSRGNSKKQAKKHPIPPRMSIDDLN